MNELEFIQRGFEKPEPDAENEPSHFDPLVGTQEDKVKAFLGRGKAFMTLEKTSRNEEHLIKAIADFCEAIKLNPNNPKAFFQRGLAKFRLGPLAKDKETFSAVLLNAVNDFHTALGLEDSMEEAVYYYFNGGLVALALGEYRGALDELGNAIKYSKEKFFGFYLVRGMALGSLKKFQLAILDFEKASELSQSKTTKAEAHFNLGLMYFQLWEDRQRNGRKEDELFKKAMEYYRSAIQCKPDYVDVYINMSTAYILTKQFQKAVDVLNV